MKERPGFVEVRLELKRNKKSRTLCLAESTAQRRLDTLVESNDEKQPKWTKNNE